MSQDIEKACDDILSLGILDHEYGIPSLWQNANVTRDLDLEDEYYQLNQQLAAELDRLVYLNRMKELRGTSPEEITLLYEEMTQIDQLKGLSDNEIEHFMKTHTDHFKTTALLNEYLALALPLIRAVYHGNSTLAHSEFTILNNLKKLYSQYNEHPANISRLMGGYEAQNENIAKEADLLVQIDKLFSTSITERFKELDELNQEYLVFQNTYANQIQSQTDASSQLPTEVKRLRTAVGGLAKKMTSVSILCDLLPNLVLCQSSNWYNDRSLVGIIEDCQDTAEGLSEVEQLSTRTIKRTTVESILKMDFEEIAEAVGKVER